MFLFLLNDELLIDHVMDANNAACREFGYDKSEFLDMTPVEIVAKGFWYEEIPSNLDDKGSCRTFGIVRNKDGRIVPVQISVTLFVHYGKTVALCLFNSETTTREHADRYRRMVQLLPDAIIIHKDGIIRFANPAAVKIVGGHSPEDLLGKRVVSFVHPDYQHTTYAIRDGQARPRQGDQPSFDPTETRILRLDGTDAYVESVGLEVIDNGEPCVLSISHDITSRKRAEEKLKYMAYHEPLTDLPNRNMFSEALDSSLIEAQQNYLQVAVLLLDLDGFKFVNDSFGHAFGDKLLRQVVKRIRACTQGGELLAHMGGDDFSFLVPRLSDAMRVTEMARAILARFEESFRVNDMELHLTGSVGISLFPSHGTTRDELMKNADAAMYLAKERGGNQFQMYRSEVSAKAIERVTLERDLRKALERDEFVLYYQPKLNVRTKQVVGVEALIRWQRPEIGLVSPLNFIPLAEETGLIVPIGEWVLRTACAQNRAWQERGVSALRVAVNVSAAQFQRSDMVETVKRVLQETGLDPRWLEIEITESTLMQSPDEVASALQQLKKMGVRLSIDDFGTGYSSFSYLKRFQLHSLKIDGSFVQDATRDADAGAIVTAIINLAHNLHIRVIAEGVETPEQWRFLREKGCDEVQGYLFLRPVPVDDFEMFRKTYKA